jgi:heat shock protein HslJ
MGHDIFEVKNNTLTRTFPLYTKNDTNISPTGGKAVLVYSLKKEKGAYSIIYSRTVAPPDQSGSSTTSEITSLSGTSWVWNIPKNKITPPTPKQEKAFVLSFGKDNTVTSTTDCNSMTGTYAASGTSLLFGTFAATLMYCEGSQEGAYSESLSKVRLYKVEAETLTLSLTNDELMTFKRK